MSVDVVQLVRRDASVFERPVDRAHGACAVCVGHDEMMSVGGGAEAGQLDVNVESSASGGFFGLEDNDACAFAGDEAVSIGVEGSARRLLDRRCAS